MTARTDKLDAAVDKILAGEQGDPWTDLVTATVVLGAALARWDDARRAYIATQPPRTKGPAAQDPGRTPGRSMPSGIGKIGR